jgi:hypothetical protein
MSNIQQNFKRENYVFKIHHFLPDCVIQAGVLNDKQLWVCKWDGRRLTNNRIL